MAQCLVKGCKSEATINGGCDHHHARLLKTGTWDDLFSMSFEERLWSWIDKRGPDECWPWLMKSRTSGYGSIIRSSKEKKRVLAHRAVWESTNGPIPNRPGHHGAVIMHTCDNRLCCNPSHLRVGSQGENVRDMDAKGRRKSRIHFGESHGNSKMTVAGVQEIRRGQISDEEAARKYGMAPSSIKQIRLGRIWRHVETVGAKKRERVMPKGSANHASKLTEELVRDLRAGRKTTKEVAALTGASQVSIDSAKRGATWKHLI